MHIDFGQYKSLQIFGHLIRPRVSRVFIEPSNDVKIAKVLRVEVGLDQSKLVHRIGVVEALEVQPVAVERHEPGQLVRRRLVPLYFIEVCKEKAFI